MRFEVQRVRFIESQNNQIVTLVPGTGVRNSVIAGVISSQTPLAFAGDLDFVRNSDRSSAIAGCPQGES